MRAARSALALAALCTCLASPAPSMADGDPPSDVLLYQEWYLPFRSPSASAKASVTAVVAGANQVGYPIRVAIIQSRTDLGSIPQLFGKPQTYASFLAQELAFGYRKRVLVVMPAGYGFSPGLVKATGAQADSGTGYAPLPDRAELRLLRSLAKPAGPSSDQLAAAAGKAVRALARAAGHPLTAHQPVPTGQPGSSSGASPPSQGGSSGSISAARIAVAAAAALAVLAVGLGTVALVLRRTQRSAPGDGDDS
jgi:hypothetical protein